MNKLFQSFLSDRFLRVVLNGQSSNWSPVLEGIPQGSLLGPLLFLVYINGLPDNLESLAKLFPGDASIFSTVYNPLLSAEIMNKDLINTSKWAYQWKMSSNADITKQAQEVILYHPTVYFNHAPVAHTNCHKHFGMYLDEKLKFLRHIKEKKSKANRGIAVIRKIRHIIPRHSLIIIHKSFVRSDLDYGDIIYDQPNHECFCNKVERVQYNAALAITGAIRGTSQTYILLKLTFAEQMHLIIHFFPIPFLNGTNLSQTCAMLNHTQDSVNRY